MKVECIVVFFQNVFTFFVNKINWLSMLETILATGFGAYLGYKLSKKQTKNDILINHKLSIFISLINELRDLTIKIQANRVEISKICEKANPVDKNEQLKQLVQIANDSMVLSTPFLFYETYFSNDKQLADLFFEIPKMISRYSNEIEELAKMYSKTECQKIEFETIVKSQEIINYILQLIEISTIKMSKV